MPVAEFNVSDVKKPATYSQFSGIGMQVHIALQFLKHIWLPGIQTGGSVCMPESSPIAKMFSHFL